MGKEVNCRKWQRGITINKSGSKFTHEVQIRGHHFVLKYVTSLFEVLFSGQQLYLYIYYHYSIHQTNQIFYLGFRDPQLPLYHSLYFYYIFSLYISLQISPVSIETIVLRYIIVGVVSFCSVLQNNITTTEYPRIRVILCHHS